MPNDTGHIPEDPKMSIFFSIPKKPIKGKCIHSTCADFRTVRWLAFDVSHVTKSLLKIILTRL